MKILGMYTTHSFTDNIIVIRNRKNKIASENRKIDKIATLMKGGILQADSKFDVYQEW